MNKTAIDSVLAESFKELCLQKPVEKITIKEITDGAGVIRPTFYNHFQDKYELIEWIINEDLLEPLRPLISAGMIRESMILLFTNIAKEKDFYQKLVKLEGPITFHQICQKCVENVLLQVLGSMLQGKQVKHSILDVQMLSLYYAQSMVFAGEEWIKRGITNITPTEMADAYMYLINHSLSEIVSDS